jgi:hypothetical protein
LVAPPRRPYDFVHFTSFSQASHFEGLALDRESHSEVDTLECTTFFKYVDHPLAVEFMVEESFGSCVVDRGAATGKYHTAVCQTDVLRIAIASNNRRLQLRDI